MRVEQSSTLGTVALHPLTCITPTDIPLSIFHHVHPPVGFQESTLHLPRTRVPSSREAMFIAEKTLPCICRHPCHVAISPQSWAVPHPSIVEFIWLGDIYHTFFWSSVSISDV